MASLNFEFCSKNMFYRKSSPIFSSLKTEAEPKASFCFTVW